MRGFVAVEASAYRRALDFLLDRSATAGYPLEVFQFSHKVTSLGNVGTATVLDPAFYSGGETSFPNLLGHIVESGEPGTISLIVSDVVQSGRTGDQRDLVLAFQKVAKAGKQVAMLAFRSAFRGTYWVESKRIGRTRFELNLDGRTSDQGRPFYVILIADTREELAEARRYLLPDIDGYEEFDASSPGLLVEDVAFVPPDLQGGALWNLYRAAEKLPGGSGYRAALSFVEIGATAAETSPLRLRLKTPASGPQSTGAIRSPGIMEFSVERRTYRNGRWSEIEAVPMRPEALFKASDLDVTYPFPRPRPMTWDVYRVRMSPGPANLRVPSWVDEWTTLDDSLEMWGNRTLKLDLFVEAMNRSIRERVPFTEQFILLGRGER